MRTSVFEPGFIWGTRVFVDGVEVTDHVHTADEERGMAWGYDTDERGRHYVTKDESGETIVAPRVWGGAGRIELPARA